MNIETEHNTLLLGETLKAGREKRNMSHIDVARYLCLNANIIEKIEQNCDEKMIQDVFYRGYIRSYAKLVGMSDDELNQYLGVAQPVTITPIAQNHARSLPGIKKTSSKKGLWMLLAAVAVAGAAWWMWGTNPAHHDVDESHFVPSTLENGAPANAPVATEQITEPTAEPEQTSGEKDKASVGREGDVTHLAQQEMATQQTANETQNQNANTTENAQQTAPESTLRLVNSTTELEGNVPDAPAPLTETSAKMLSMTFSGDCWLKIVDVQTSQILFTGIKRAGETLEFDEKTKYAITLGNINTAEMTFNQQKVNLTEHARRNNSAQFTLDATSL